MRMTRSAGGIVRLGDGRALGFAAFGPPAGTPVLYFHGVAGSPMRCSDTTAMLLERLGVRWVVVQRPGFGSSHPSPGRSLGEWPADVETLLDALELPAVRILGVSAGAPYALACAGALGARVDEVACVSAVGPPERPFGCVRMRSRVSRGLARFAARPLAACGDALMRAVNGHREPFIRFAERRALEPHLARETLTAGIAAAAERGTMPVLEDLRVVLSRWRLPLEDVSCPVALWHGADDGVVPLWHATRLLRALPDARLRVCQREGHFFFRRRMGEIVEALVDGQRVAVAEGFAAGEPLAERFAAGEPLRAA